MLAAGMGRRLGDYTKDNTKCMLSVNGVKLIDRVIDMLAERNISRLVMVVGYKAQNVIDYLNNRDNKGLKIEFITNEVYDKTNNIYSLSLAKEVLCEEDTILLESDLIYEPRMLDLLLNHTDKNLALVAKYESWMDGTMVRIDENRNIINFVPKEAFRYEEVDQYYKTVNIYKFSKEFSRDFYVPFLEAYCKVMGKNEYYEQVLRILLHLHNSPLKALPITNEKWYEIDDVQDLDIASCIFSKKEEKYKMYHRRYGGFWRFPQMLDYCYLVNPFFPPKRMKDELRANFEVLLSNYPSGMYVNSLLAGKYFGIKQDYVVVGNGAAELIKVIMENHSEDKVGVIFPTFDEYPNRLKPDQIVPFVVDSPDFRYTANDLMSYFEGKGIKLLLLINPDNPSGNFIPTADVLQLADWCAQRKIHLIVDESFVDFTYGYENNSLLHDEILEKYPTMMVMKSISKSYGVPGLRLGIFASANKELIAKIKKEVSIWNINSFGEFYMQIFGKYEKDYKNACAEFIKEREHFYKELDTIPFLHVMPSQANYFLCEVTSRYTSAELTQKLIDANVIISNCGLKKNMAGKQLIRIAVRSREDNTKLINILKTL